MTNPSTLFPESMEPTPLTALTPLDGRYARATAPLAPIGSEYGLIRYRMIAEIAWLRALCAEPGIPEARPLTSAEQRQLETWTTAFSSETARAVKAFEAETNHDVKAVEYALKALLRTTSMADLSEFVHFACTSEDINNIAHALTARDGLAVLRDAQDGIADDLGAMARQYRDLPMLSRTHGQSATPTTVGKELAVFVHRLRQASERLDAIRLPGKFNGATGTFSAHVAACPAVDWIALSQRVVEQDLGLRFAPLTTQIEPHDTLAELFDALSRWNTILLDVDRDIWQYISMAYFSQRPVAGEVGSSTMPHKVNPIDFENSEGNLGLANALLDHMARKLPVSRLQRDLSDSTVLRNIGSAFGYCLVAYKATRKGLGKIHANPDRLAADLSHAWEVLAEPIQTLMRKAGLPDPYERMKMLTRGRAITPDALRDFIQGLELPEADKMRLLALTPAGYTGLAAQLTDRLDASSGRHRARAIGRRK